MTTPQCINTTGVGGHIATWNAVERPAQREGAASWWRMALGAGDRRESTVIPHPAVIDQSAFRENR